MSMALRTEAAGKNMLEKMSQRWTGTVLDLEAIGYGVSGVVFIIDDSRVIKAGFGSVESRRDIETERCAYRILARAKELSPYVLKCFDVDDPRGLILERCKETVRCRLRSIGNGITLPDEKARKWARQAAEGLAFIHDCGIIHSDFGCHNMLLDEADDLKLCDFAGSSVNGAMASTDYELRSRLPFHSQPSKITDIFALGSALYEISTSEPPFHNKSNPEVLKLYREGIYSSVENVVSLGNIITNCWSQKYTTVSEIAYEIDPQRPLCYEIVEETIERAVELPVKVLGFCLSQSTSSSSSSMISGASPKTSEVSARTSMSSSHTTTSSGKVLSTPLKSYRKTSFRSPNHGLSSSEFRTRGTTIHSHPTQHRVDLHGEAQTISKEASDKNNEKPIRHRKRQRSRLPQWFNISLQISWRKHL